MFRWPKFFDYRDIDEIMMVGDPRVYELVEKMIKLREKHNLFATRYEYCNEFDIITLTSNDIKVVINMSNKVVQIENKKLLLTTNKTQLDKYDLAIYKK